MKNFILKNIVDWRENALFTIKATSGNCRRTFRILIVFAWHEDSRSACNHISRPLHLILARILAKVIYDTKKDKVLPIPVVFTKKHMVRFWILYSLSKRFHWNQTSFIPFTKLFYAYQISSGGHTGTVHVQRTSSLNIENCDFKYYLKRIYVFLLLQI